MFFTLAHLSKNLVPPPPAPPVENETLITDGTIVGYSFTSEFEAGFPIYAEFSPDDLSKIDTLDCIYYSVYDYNTNTPFSSPAKVYYNSELGRWELQITNAYNNKEELYAYSDVTEITDISKINWFFALSPDINHIEFAATIARSGTNYLKLSNTNTDADGFYFTPTYQGTVYMCSMGMDKPNYVQLSQREKPSIFVLDRDSNKMVKYFVSEEQISYDNIPGDGGAEQAKNLILSNTIKWIPVDGTPATAENLPKFELLTVE